MVETITPGTIIQENLLQAKKNNHLVSLAGAGDGGWGLASLDLSTGEVEVQRVDGGDVVAELGRLEPSELLVSGSGAQELRLSSDGSPLDPSLTIRDDWVFDEKLAREEVERTYRVHSLEGLGFLARGCALGSGDGRPPRLHP